MIEQGVTVISSSWSLCEGSATPPKRHRSSKSSRRLPGNGVTTFFAVNDAGNACNVQVDRTHETTFPTGAPYTVAVGGSILTIGDNGQYYGESWWGSGDASPADCVQAFNSGGGSRPPTPNNGGCGGFGQSALYPAPTWQLPNIPVATPTMRSVPMW